jgi:hypothetical protein
MDQFVERFRRREQLQREKEDEGKCRPNAPGTRLAQ